MTWLAQPCPLTQRVTRPRLRPGMVPFKCGRSDPDRWAPSPRVVISSPCPVVRWLAALQQRWEPIRRLRPPRIRHRFACHRIRGRAVASCHSISTQCPRTRFADISCCPRSEVPKQWILLSPTIPAPESKYGLPIIIPRTGWRSLFVGSPSQNVVCSVLHFWFGEGLWLTLVCLV